MIFRPVQLDPDYVFSFDAPFSEHFLETPDGARLNLLYFPKKANMPLRGAVLYFHGNRDNVQRWGRMHTDFTERGFDFIIPDYRGYGKSSGEPGERRYYEDARRVYDWVRERHPADRVVLYGRSLGSGMASYLAAHVRARCVILETPFSNIPNLLTGYSKLIKLTFQAAFFFPNDRHLRQSALPITIFHGTADRVVPYAVALQLKPSLKPDDQFFTIEGGTHHNLREYAVYQENLDRLFRTTHVE